jgi:hypothetical protein
MNISQKTQDLKAFAVTVTIDGQYQWWKNSHNGQPGSSFRNKEHLPEVVAVLCEALQQAYGELCMINDHDGRSAIQNEVLAFLKCHMDGSLRQAKKADNMRRNR